MPTKRRVSERKKSASRANGALSRGPVTPEGKARSSRNNFRHGLLSRGMLLPSENPEKFAAFNAGIANDFEIRSASEDLFAQQFAMAGWRLHRLWDLQATALRNEVVTSTTANNQTPEAAGSNASLDAWKVLCETNFFPLLRRYEANYDRQMHRSFSRLEALGSYRGPFEPTVSVSPAPSTASPDVCLPDSAPLAANDPDPRAVNDPDPRAANDSEPRAVNNSEPRAVNDPDLRAANNSEPRAANDSDQRAANNSEPPAANDPDPRAVNDPEPRAANDSEPRAGNDSEPSAANNPEPSAANCE